MVMRDTGAVAATPLPTFPATPLPSPQDMTGVRAMSADAVSDRCDDAA